MKTIHTMTIAALLAAFAGAPAWADDDEPALHRAAKRGNVQEVQRLIAGGANVNATDEDGETALMEAADKGRLEVVRALLAAGANANATNEDGETALMIAAGEGQLEVVRLSAFANLSNDEIASVTGYSAVNVRTLLSRGRKKIKELYKKYLQS